MVRRPVIMLLLIGALLASCASDTTGAAGTSSAGAAESPAAAAAAPSPSAADATCEQLANALIAELQTISDSIADKSAAEIAQDNQLIDEAGAKIDDIAQQLDDAGCREEVQQRVSDRVDELSEGASAEFLRNLLESSDLDSNS
jgi:hypothetical protein